MPVTDHTSNVLAALIREFPLAARLERLEPEAQRTYGAIVAEWYGRGVAPQPNRFRRTHLEALERSDAVLVTPLGISCYPFSAAPTNFHVRYLDYSCHAMCAIDALAIPCLVGLPAEIEAVCDVCHRPLSISVNPSRGSQGLGSSDIAVTHSGIAVLYNPSQTEHEICCRQLCPSIVFACEDCVDLSSAQPQSVITATIVAAEFFAFQRKYLPAAVSATQRT